MNIINKLYGIRYGRSIVLIAFLMLALPFALGQKDKGDNPPIVLPGTWDVNVEVRQEAGVTSASLWWGIERVMEQLNIALTFDPATKAKKGLAYADERLAEMQVLLTQNKFAEANEAQESYDTELDNAIDNIEQIESDAETADAEKELEEVATLQTLIETHSQKVSEIKDKILVRQKDRMTEEQIANLGEVFRKISHKSQELKSRTSEKREKIKLKYKVLNEATDKEVAKVEQKIQQRIKNREDIRIEIKTETADTEKEIKIEKGKEETKIIVRSDDGSEVEIKGKAETERKVGSQVYQEIVSEPIKVK